MITSHRNNNKKWCRAKCQNWFSQLSSHSPVIQDNLLKQSSQLLFRQLLYEAQQHCIKQYLVKRNKTSIHMMLKLLSHLSSIRTTTNSICKQKFKKHLMKLVHFKNPSENIMRSNWNRRKKLESFAFAWTSFMYSYWPKAKSINRHQTQSDNIFNLNKYRHVLHVLTQEKNRKCYDERMLKQNEKERDVRRSSNTQNFQLNGPYIREWSIRQFTTQICTQ